MSSRKHLAAAPLPSFAKLDSLARQSGLISRFSPKFSASGFLFSLLQGVAWGGASLNQLALGLSKFQHQTLSRQAIHQRFSPASSEFLVRVIAQILSVKRPPLPGLESCEFGRVLIEDSTVLSMAKSNAEHFPNNGNCRGVTAGAKINLVTDLRTGNVVISDLHAARNPDQKIAWDTALVVEEGDLLIRDMGYFSIEPLQEIEQRKAFWISRLPASVSARTLDGRELVSLLKKTDLNQLDLSVVVGRGKRSMRCRLVATRLDSKTASKHRRKRRKDCRKRGSGATPLKEALVRDGWSLIVTNLPAERVEMASLYRWYSMRWSVEIKFRAMKQACRIHQSLNHRSNPFHIEAMLLATMIFQLMSLSTHAAHHRARSDCQQPSLEKVSDAFAIHLMSLDRERLTKPFRPDPRHLSHDKRTRVTQWESVIQSLA